MLFGKRSSSGKGQVTIFILIGIGLLIALYVIYLVVVNSQPQDSNVVTSAYDFRGATTVFEHCANQQATRSIQLISHSGGFFSLPADSTTLVDPYTSYHYKQGRVLVPKSSTVEAELADSLNELIRECVNEVRVSMPGVSVEEPSTLNITSHLMVDSVQFGIDYPLILHTNSSTHTLYPLTINIAPIHLSTLLDISRQIAEDQASHPDTLCLSCFSQLADENNVRVDYMRLQGGNIIMYSVTDLTSSIDGTPISLTFAHSYENNENP